MMQTPRNRVAMTAAWLLALAVSARVDAQVISIAVQSRNTPVDFRREILPILQKSCLACHSESDVNGGLVLETPAAILKGGDSGPAVIAKNSDKSLLLEVASHRSDPKMPPPRNAVAAPNLTPQQLGLIKLWIDQGAVGSTGSDSLSPEKWRALPRALNPIYAVAVTPDGQFAACGRGNQIDIYHVATGQLITRLSDPALPAQTPNGKGPAQRDVVQALAFNSAGDLLASGGFREVKLWRRPSDVRRLNLPAKEAVAVVAVSPSGQTAAVAALDHSIQLWNVTDGQPGLVLTGHTAAITSLQFSPDGTRLVSGSTDKSLRTWDVASGALQGRINTGGEIQAVAIVAENVPLPVEAGAEPKSQSVERLVSGGTDTFVRLWQFPASLSEPLEDTPVKPTVLAVSPDRKLLALANAAGVVRVLDFQTRQVIQTWQTHGGAIHDLAFRSLPPVTGDAPQAADALKDAGQLATAGADRTVRIWNYGTGKPLGVLRGSLAPIHSVAWQPDGKRLVAGAADGSLTLWNALHGPRRTFEGLAGPATVSVVSPDGKRLATSGIVNERPAIVVRDLATGAVTRTLLGHNGPVTALAFSVDNTKLVSGSADQTARVWDLADARFPEIAQLAGHTGAVTAVAFNTDGQQVLTGSADMAVKLWTVATEKELANLAGHTGAIVAVAMPGNQPTSASADKTVRVWNPANGQPVRSATAESSLTAMAVSRDNAQLAAAGEDGRVQLFTFANLQVKSTLAGHTKPVASLGFSPDNTRLVTGAADDTAIVWNVADGRLLEIFPVEQGLASATFGPDAASVLVGDQQGTIELRSLQFAVALNGIAKRVTATVFSANGQTVFAASEDGTVRGFNGVNGQQAFSANHGAPVHDLALSPNEQLLVSAGENQLIRVWNAGGAAVAPQQLAGFTGPVSSVAFTADSTRVIGAGQAEAGELLVFNLMNAGELEESLQGHQAGILSVALAGATEPRVVSASSDQTVRTWELNSLRRIPGHTQPVTSLAAILGAPGQVLSGSRDATLRRWNLANGQAILQLNHGAPVLAVAVRPDGERFASVGENGIGRLWNGANGQQLGEFRGDLRAKNAVAKLTQQQADVTAKVAAEKTILTAAEALVPTRMAVAKTAADALTAATADVAAKSAVVKQTGDTKTAAEQQAIVAAAAAQKAAGMKTAADQAAVTAADVVQAATVKLTRAKAVSAADPANQNLSQLATAAQTALDQANAALTAATAAKAAPTKAAADTAAAAVTATTAALATGKPFTDAATALKTSETAQKAAAQAADFAARDAKAAADAVPVLKAELAASEAMLERLKTELAAATKAAADAEKPLRTVAFSPDNLQLATGGDLGVVHTWNADTGVAVASYVGHQGPIPSLAFTPDKGLVSGSADKSARVWDLYPGWVLERTIGKMDDPETLANRVMALDFSEDDQFLATGGGVPSRSGELKLWKVADGTLAREISEPHTDIVYGVAFSQDGRFLATAGGDKYVRKFNAETGKMLQQFEGHTDHVLDVSWRADGKVLASCGADNMVMTWNPDNGDRFQTYGGYNRQASAVKFVGGTNITISCSADRNLRLHNSDNGGVVSSFSGTGADFLYSVDATPDRQFIVAGGFDGVLRIWNGNAPNSQPLKQMAPPQDSELADPDAVARGKLPAK